MSSFTSLSWHINNYRTTGTTPFINCMHLLLAGRRPFTDYFEPVLTFKRLSLNHLRHAVYLPILPWRFRSVTSSVMRDIWYKTVVQPTRRKCMQAACTLSRLTKKKYYCANISTVVWERVRCRSAAMNFQLSIVLNCPQKRFPKDSHKRKSFLIGHCWV